MSTEPTPVPQRQDPQESPETENGWSALRVDPTGIPNLDQVVGGGIPRGSLVIVVGPPGSGKTTLANQMAFAAARAGRRSIVLTALSEPTSKLIAHLRTFGFYDDDLVGDELQYLSLQQFLSDGLDATQQALISTVRHGRATFVVLDGFRGVRGVENDPQAARQFLYTVGTTLSVLGTTTIITTEADPRDPTFFPEATTGDMILGLRYVLRGVRQFRGLEAIKVRGAAPLAGLHGMILNREGIVVFPRLEARIAAATQGTRTGEFSVADRADDLLEQSGHLDGRAAFDLPDLDELLGGGLTRGTSTLVVGSLGTGKTTLALHFTLAGVRAGEPTLLLSFRESHRQLLLKTEPFTLGAELRTALETSSSLTLVRWSPIELNPDVLASQVLDILDTLSIRRLIVDSAAELERAVSESGSERLENYLTALVEALRLRGVTALFTKEIPQISAPELDFAENPISVMAENVLLLRRLERDGWLHRILSVVKTRYSPNDSGTLREFTITAPQGFQLLSTSESDDEVLDTVASTLAGELGTSHQGYAGTEAGEEDRPRRPHPRQPSGSKPVTDPLPSSEGSDQNSEETE